MRNKSVNQNDDAVMNSFQASKSVRRRGKDLRRAKALRKLELLREKHQLEAWMTEIWDEPDQSAHSAQKNPGGKTIYQH